MKLLIITQRVDKNDPILGFFHRWLEEFAKHCEKLTVICLQKGEYSLPRNISVFSLGKEKLQAKSCKPKAFEKINYIIYFYKLIFSKRKDYDAVFVHMNPIYIVLGGIFWRMWHKKIGLWYTHKSVDLKLRIAEKLAGHVFTASGRSFRLKSKKVHILGHGIDVDELDLSARGQSADKNEILRIVHVGRITKSKNISTLLEAARVLSDRGVPVTLSLAGGPTAEEDKTYIEALHKYIADSNLRGKVSFMGNIPHRQILDIYAQNDVAINISDTGSMDKAVLEAMASGIQVLTSNEAFKDILPAENQTTKDPARIADDLNKIRHMQAPAEFRNYITENHSLKMLIPRIISYYEQ